MVCGQQTEAFLVTPVKQMKYNLSQRPREGENTGLWSWPSADYALGCVKQKHSSPALPVCNLVTDWDQTHCCRPCRRLSSARSVSTMADQGLVKTVDMETSTDNTLKRVSKGLQVLQPDIMGDNPPLPTCKRTVSHLSMCPSLVLLSKCLLFLFCLDVVTLSVSARPLLAAMRALSKKDRFVYHSEPMDSTGYLMKFGYLPKSDIETGALRNRTELTKAVKKFQKMAHLPVTGRLDDQTVQKMQQPRCGVSDDIDSYFQTTSRRRYKRYVLGPSTWPDYSRNLTFRILNYPRELQMHETRSALTRAFNLWRDSSQLTFREVYDGQADLMIKFASYYHNDGYPFDGRGMTLAHAFFPGPDTGGDIHFDDDEPWTVGTHEGLNLFTVAAHEMGHALGLGHSSVEGSLMYPWYQGYVPDLELHNDDLAAIQYLYGTNGNSGHYPYDSHTTSTRAPTDTTRPYASIPPAFTTKVPATPTTQNIDYPPDACATEIDAAALIRQEVYFFKGLWFWRIDKNGIMAGYPVKLERFWYGLPEDVLHIDAVYERNVDGKIIFFSGRRFWVFIGNRMDTDCPPEGRPLTDMGFPNDIDHVDAAYVWGYNFKTYFITGSMYWRYNEEDHQMDFHYPRDFTDMWRGVPVPVHAAFKLWDGNTYFFQGKKYWKYHDAVMRVERDYPQPIGPFWLECLHEPLPATSTYGPEISAALSVHHSTSAVNIILQICICFASLMSIIHS